MHELSITQRIVDMVADHAGDSKVLTVHVSVGRLSGVVPDAMRFCFDLLTEGTPLEGATLAIDEPAGLARCAGCGTDFTLSDLVLLCPCGSTAVELLAGRELRVTSLEVA